MIIDNWFFCYTGRNPEGIKKSTNQLGQDSVIAYQTKLIQQGTDRKNNHHSNKTILKH